MPASVELELQVAGSADGLPAEHEIRAWLEASLHAAMPRADGTYELVVRVVDEPESSELNSRYRSEEKPTNVLAFPAASPEELPQPGDGPTRILGDLVLCGPVIAREAVSQNKAKSAHWAHLLVHGALHLLGFDHQTEEQAIRMEELEKRILAGRGVDDPYGDR